MISKCYVPYIEHYRSCISSHDDTGIDMYCSWFGECSDMGLSRNMVFSTYEDAANFAQKWLDEEFDTFNDNCGVQENTLEWYKELWDTSNPNLQVVDKDLNPLDIKVV